MLWVGCGNVQTETLLYSYDPDLPLNGSEVVWHTFPYAEVPIFKFKSYIKKLFGKINIQGPLNKLDSELDAILKAQSAIFIRVSSKAQRTSSRASSEKQLLEIYMGD